MPATELPQSTLVIPRIGVQADQVEGDSAPEPGRDTSADPDEEPTVAPVEIDVDKNGYVCVDEDEPRFARLMHDSQWMEWPSRIADPDWPRGFSLDWYPETVPLWTRPRSGDGRVPYNRAWLEYLRALQPNDEAAVWITTIAAGLFNKGNGFIPILDLGELEEKPVAEGISSGGNVVKVWETRSGSARIEMLYLNDGPPDPAEVNYFNTPWLVTKFTSISAEGELGNAGGIDVYFPNVAVEDCGYWVDLKRVEMFPRLPFDAVVSRSTTIRAEPSPSAAAVGSAEPGQALTIHEYMPRASNVWGRTDSGWLLLEYLSGGKPVYTTSWSMATRPPILIP